MKRIKYLLAELYPFGTIFLVPFLIGVVKTRGCYAKGYLVTAAKYRYREYVYSVAVYQKYLTRLGELIIFEPWRENYHFSQPS